MDCKDEIILIQERLLQLATKAWHKAMSEILKMCCQYKVYDFMQDMYEKFHVQGDSSSFNVLESYLKNQRVEV